MKSTSFFVMPLSDQGPEYLIPSGNIGEFPTTRPSQRCLLPCSVQDFQALVQCDCDGSMVRAVLALTAIIAVLVAVKLFAMYKCFRRIRKLDALAKITVVHKRDEMQLTSKSPTRSILERSSTAQRAVPQDLDTHIGGTAGPSIAANSGNGGTAAKGKAREHDTSGNIVFQPAPSDTWETASVAESSQSATNRGERWPWAELGE